MAPPQGCEDGYCDTRTEITLPAVVTGGTDVLVRAVGKVLRVEELTANGEPRIGVAVMIDAYEIVRQETRAAAG